MLAGLMFLAFIVLVVGFGALLLIGLLVALVYNKLVTLRNRVENSWAQIDVQLKRRFDLIPNLVETVKGYAKHEKETFQKVTEARAAMANAKTVKEQADANNMLTEALKTLFAVAENYPELKANENFMDLQQQLSETEDKIAYSRQFYNDSVMKLNVTVEKFPTNLLAGLLGFSKREYFEAAGEEKEVVKVKF